MEVRSFDAADVLDTAEAIEAYLEDAFESENPKMIAYALGVVARAKGMGRVADATGLTRQALYKALSPEGNPEFATILKAMQALGFRLAAKPRAA